MTVPNIRSFDPNTCDYHDQLRQILHHVFSRSQRAACATFVDLGFCNGKRRFLNISIGKCQVNTVQNWCVCVCACVRHHVLSKSFLVGKYIGSPGQIVLNPGNINSGLYTKLRNTKPLFVYISWGGLQKSDANCQSKIQDPPQDGASYFFRCWINVGSLIWAIYL